MGRLRADKITGLGGASAFKGSVFFGSDDESNYNENLAITNTSDLDIGAGNFTIEYWFNCSDTTIDGFNTSIALSEYTNTSSNSAFNIYHYNKGFRIFNRTGGGFVELSNPTDKWIPSKWHHFAWVRSGTGTNENAIYVDGVSIDTFTNAVNYTSGQHWLIGANFYTGSNGYGVNPEYGFAGYISNVRVSNVARYSGAFTPSTIELPTDSNTIILACQSPSSILKEETGKEVTFYKGLLASSPPQASHFSPNSLTTYSQYTDQGTNVGTTFNGFGNFASSTYMVPAGGLTREAFPKSVGNIVSDNLLFHLDGGDSLTYAGVSTSTEIVYDMQQGANTDGNVGIATLNTGHSDFKRACWVPDNRGCFRVSSDSAHATFTGNFIELPNMLLGNNNYTINVWVKLNTVAQGGDELMHIISNKDGGPVSFSAQLKMHGGFARIAAQAYNGSWLYRYSTTTRISTGIWYMLTWMNTEGSTGVMYVDGVLQTLDDGNTTWNSSSSNNTPINATSYAGVETFDGWIGQIQIYSDTLSATEILQNYNAHKCRYISDADDK